MKPKFPLKRQIQLALGVSMALLLAVGTSSYRGMAVSDESDRWVRHTHEVIENLKDLSAAMQSADSSYRGFVITGDEISLQPYLPAIARSEEAQANIRDLTVDSSVQQLRIRSLMNLGERKVQYAETVISLRRTKGMDAAADFMREGGGQEITGQFQEIIRNMQDEEQRLLVIRDAEATRRSRQFKIMLVFGTLLGLLLAIGAGWNAQRKNFESEFAEELNRLRYAIERRAMEEELSVEKERAQVTLNCIGDAVICTDASGNITFLNLVAEKMTSWSRQDAFGRPMAEVFRILDANTREPTPNPLERSFERNCTARLPPNYILVRRDGTDIPIEDSVAPIHDREGKATGAVIVLRDVSAARAMALEMTHSAQHDFLTGMPNRMLLNDRVNQAIAWAQRNSKKVAVLYLDLDGFKHINDSLGHPTGDKLLQSVAKRLVDCVRGSDTVSRQGGDEFVVLLTEVGMSEDAAITARRMLQTVAEAHSINQHDLYVTTSIGVSVFPDDGSDAETLIKNADTAMYQAKESGRQSYQFFKPAMNVRAVERQSIEESLRRALEREEFMVHYQPKVNLSTGLISGAEALIRWKHPVRGLVPPSDFIPIAEDCGLIVPIGNWVLREACKQACAWAKAGLPMITMAMNISAMEFRDADFLDGVFRILRETALDPKLLELELSESVLMKRAESTQSILNTLRASGVRLAVDDFGTGYSSLSYLRKFPIDALKIDQSFIRQITTAPDETTIVTAVISMGRSLKLRVVAEGVETPEELAFLQARQCDEAQGYYFSRPVLPEQFAKLLEKGIPEPILSET